MKLLLLLTLYCTGLVRCTKIMDEPCQSITLVFKESRKEIIHWHSVCDEELKRFQSMPKYSTIAPGCDQRIQEMIIKPCYKKH